MVRNWPRNEEPRLPLELEMIIAACCRDQDREETYRLSDPTSHWAKTRWTSLSKLRLASRHWNTLATPLIYQSYDLLLKEREDVEKSFADLEQQVQVVSKNRGQLIQHVCSIVRITTDAARLTRTLTLLADFARSLPNLKDFWVLFQTTPDVAASEGAGPVKVFALDAVNMGHLELALRDKASLRRLSLICESTAEDQPTVLLRLPSAMSIFESLRHLQTLALRGCIPVPAANEAKDLSLLSPTLSRLKIHNAGILRTHTSVLTDSWHFCITPRLPPQLTRLALVLVDTTLPNLLRLLASAANTLDRLSLMGVFLTDVHDDPQSTLDERGAVRCQELAKIIKPLHLGALSFGRVTCLTGNAGAPPAIVASLLLWLVNGSRSTLSDLCLQASDSFGSPDVVAWLNSAERPRSLKNLLWWHQDSTDIVANGPPQDAQADPQNETGRDAESHHQHAQITLPFGDLEVYKACQVHGINWLTKLSDPLLDCLVQE